MSFDLLKYPLFLMEPQRLNLVAWTENIPFAFTLVQIVKPRILVELGTNTGESYCALCQAVDILQLSTKCYAVDTWRGDEHTGHYGEKVFKDLSSYHDNLYGSFSKLIRDYFDNVVNNFPDGEIDLLHIDGSHSYEAVKHDFETWLPKVSSRGIILFHDTNEHKEGFGVWRFWDEIKNKYPSFEFCLGHGLGVLGVGSDIPEGLKPLFDSKGDEAKAISEFFNSLGNNVIQKKTLENEVARLRNELKTQELKVGLLKRWERSLRKKVVKPLKNYVMGSKAGDFK